MDPNELAYSQLQQLLGFGQHLFNTPTAAGANVGNTYVAASPIEHISNLVRQLVGGYQMGQARQGVSDLSTKILGQRKEYADSLDQASQPVQAPPNLLAAPGFDQASQDAAQGQKRSALLRQGLLSGDPAISAYATQAPKIALEEQQIRRSQAEADAVESPVAGVATRALLHKYGVDVPEGTPNPVLRALLPVAEKGHAAEESKAARLEAAKIAAQGGVNRALVTQGLTPPVPGSGPAAAPQALPLGGKQLDKALKELGADFDPSGGRAGEFGKNQARVNAANRVLALATDKNGNPVDLNPQQMPELAQSIASLISAGGQGAQSQIEHLTPKTLRGDMQRTIQWVTGNPRGADQVEFVRNMIETAKRERDTAQQGIEQVRKQRGAKNQRVLTSNPEESRKVLNGFGWDLGEDGLPVMQQPIAPAAAGAADLRKKYGL